jgi:hypothetical protein
MVGATANKEPAMHTTTGIYPFRVRHLGKEWHMADWSHAMDFAEELSNREFHKVIVDKLTHDPEHARFVPLGWFQAGDWYGGEH